MARKRKGELPSGNVRRQIYNGMKQKIDRKTGKPVFDADGKPVMIRDYISVTATDPKEVEKMKSHVILKEKGRKKPTNYTLREAINAHIDSIRATKSITTIEGYEKIRDNGFKHIMDKPLSSFTNENLQAAIDIEKNRPKGKNGKKDSISAKTLKNEWGLVSCVISKYYPELELDVSLPVSVSPLHDLSRPEEIFEIVKDTDIELAVLLAMWLSFTLSEIKGLSKSKSIIGNNLYIAEVVVDTKKGEIKKDIAKNEKRNRMHRIPPYIMELINQVETDQLVTMNGRTIYRKFVDLMKAHNKPHMTFHDLRHVSASVMSFLAIPDQYAMDRGGWKSDKVMKGRYMQLYQQERIAVDDKIDTYFETALGIAPQIDVNEQKYQAWLILYDKEDCYENRLQFHNTWQMQHEMQHEKINPSIY